LLSVPYAFYAQSSRDGLGQGSAPGNTTYWNGTTWVTNSTNLFNNGGNIGINTTTPIAMLHVKGSANGSQLIVDGSNTQSNNQPLIRLRRNNGLDVLWIHSDDPSNVFVGVEAGVNNAGTDNTGLGSGTLRDNTTGSSNTAVGLHAMYVNTTGSNNTAVGIDAMVSNMQGDSNIAVGNFALNNNVGGRTNTATGVNTLGFNTNGNLNTAYGSNALRGNLTGNGNTAIGFDALSGNATGSFRTGLGYNSNSAGSAFSNNTGVGSHVICSASNQVRIGNSEVTSIGGFADWTNVSDGRFKQDVAENVPGLDFITALRPVTYTMDTEAIGVWMEKNFGTRDAVSSTGIPRETAVVQSGFIAQEVEFAAAALGYQFRGIDAQKNY
jgi:hypothetical protein